MGKIFWQYLYYYFISPLIIFAAHFAAVFSKTVREGVIARYKIFHEIRLMQERRNNGRPTVIFHAASLGEFEHIKPLLNKLYLNQRTFNVVTFFSPSGYNHAKDGGELHLRLYIPFDLPFLWSKFYKLTKPKLILIAKHDVWPTQVWVARELGIPTYLINASLGQYSSRTRWYIKSFLKHVYRDFTQICAISSEDESRFSRHYPRCPVSFIGDTKYDQVVLRKEEAMKNELLSSSWKKQKWILVTGSVWPEDTQHLFPAIKELLVQYEHLIVIIVPHQPHAREVDRIENEFTVWKTCRFSNRDKLTDQRVLIVDGVGLLAAIYNSANVAYVGGSFKQGVHNVMEPAIYGIPVIYGPVHTNSYEAIKLNQEGGGIIIKTADEFMKQIQIFIRDEKTRKLTGQKAEKFAIKNTGATEKLLQIWRPIIGAK